MTGSTYHIPLPNLALGLGLVLIVILIHARWSLGAKTLLYATARMLLQLASIGLVLTLIFQKTDATAVCLFLSAMLLISGWIALRPVANRRRELYLRALFALSVGGVFVLIVTAGGVIRLTPWYEPRYLIPLAGMIFANSMNALSLAAERFQAERERSASFLEARAAAYRAALLPLVNSFFAVGLVSFPGMMTGQILAGVSPLVAVRYQVMVMCMLLGASGISTAIYLSLLEPRKRP